VSGLHQVLLHSEIGVLLGYCDKYLPMSYSFRYLYSTTISGYLVRTNCPIINFHTLRTAHFPVQREHGMRRNLRSHSVASPWIAETSIPFLHFQRANTVGMIIMIYPLLLFMYPPLITSSQGPPSPSDYTSRYSKA
jgi:hypothetical protein